MLDLVFIEYIFLVGLFFGLNFRHKIPFVFLVSSSFLWGSVIVSGALLIKEIFQIKTTGLQIAVFLLVLIIVPLITLFVKPRQRINQKEGGQILLFSFSFLLLNLFFHVFNISLATIDSFALMMLGRIIPYDGFSSSVLTSFTSWGLLIPLLQSISIYLGVDYLITLQVSFAFTLVSIFIYICYEICLPISNNKELGRLITALSCLILITTPMFLIQSVYIHTNLPAACFFLLSVACAWFLINKNEDSWVIFLIFSLIGLSLSRTETFIYSIPILFLLLSMKQKNVKFLNIGFVLVLISILGWLVYLLINLQGGTEILDKNRIAILVLTLILLGGFFLVSQNKKMAIYILPILNKYFLVPFLAINLLFLFLKPQDMLESNKSVLENMFFTGQWGVIFWILIATLISFVKIKQSPSIKFLYKIIISTILIICGLGFFRAPYRLWWTDSANRLVTLVFPIILLLAAVTLSSLISSAKSGDEISIVS